MTTKRVVKASDVVNFRARYKAVAECQYVDEPTETACTWAFIPHPWEVDFDCRKATRQHVLENPTHEVVVLVRDVCRYYVQEHVLVELTAATPSTDGDDQSANPAQSKED